MLMTRLLTWVRCPLDRVTGLQGTPFVRPTVKACQDNLVLLVEKKQVPRFLA